MKIIYYLKFIKMTSLLFKKSERVEVLRGYKSGRPMKTMHNVHVHASRKRVTGWRITPFPDPRWLRRTGDSGGVGWWRRLDGLPIAHWLRSHRVVTLTTASSVSRGVKVVGGITLRAKFSACPGLVLFHLKLRRELLSNRGLKQFNSTFLTCRRVSGSRTITSCRKRIKKQQY